MRYRHIRTHTHTSLYHVTQGDGGNTDDDNDDGCVLTYIRLWLIIVANNKFHKFVFFYRRCLLMIRNWNHSCRWAMHIAETTALLTNTRQSNGHFFEVLFAALLNTRRFPGRNVNNCLKMQHILANKMIIAIKACFETTREKILGRERLIKSAGKYTLK